jgi:hypothetical protein
MGVGICRPGARVEPASENPDPRKLEEWNPLEDKSTWKNLAVVARKRLPQHVEPICSGPGPPLAGLETCGGGTLPSIHIRASFTFSEGYYPIDVSVDECRGLLEYSQKRLICD